MNDYNNLINSIKLKLKILLTVFVISEVLIFIFIPQVSYLILLSILLICIYLLLMAKIKSPVLNSLEKECDPEKFRQLFFSDINKKTSGISALSANFNVSYLTGDFGSAIDYADAMISDGRFNAVVAGLSNKAIAQFFSSDYASLKETVLKYHQKISEATHLKRNEFELYLNNEIRLSLYVAIADNDIDSIRDLSQKLEITNNTMLSRVQISFLKAVSAHITGDVDALKVHIDFINQYGKNTIYSKKLSSFIN